MRSNLKSKIVKLEQYKSSFKVEVIIYKDIEDIESIKNRSAYYMPLKNKSH